MIYITGDCHGNYTKLNSYNFPEQKEMTKDDYVIITGDFGFWKDDKQQRYWMEWLEEKPFTTLWVDGNHENFDLLYSCPVSEWNGGKIHYINSSVIHLMRGQIFNIDGCKIFTFGGAKSHDISDGILEIDDPLFKKKRKELDESGSLYRINKVSWWKEEMPSVHEYSIGVKNLFKNDNTVDYIVTHCCSTVTQAIMSNGGFSSDELTDYFNAIKNTVKYKKWFFGHYHTDRQIDGSDIALYQQIVRIW